MSGDRVLVLLSRWRIDAATVLVLAVLALAHPSRRAIVAYLPLVAAGVALRTWARGHLERQAHLTCTGPYARVRHPLYVGSFLMGLAFARMTGIAALPLLFAALFLGMYWPKVLREELHQRQRWGGEWDRCASAVGPLVPRLRPAGPGVSAPDRVFTWRQVVRHREWKTWLGVVALLAAFWLRAR
jgi:protein-S-isoprenylcysteine O-methyltransferase Ste14